MQAAAGRVGRDDIHCVLVGGGPHQPSIKAYAEEIGVAELCTFTGRVSDDDLCRILSSADVGVDPDPKNAWSDKSTMNKIMEYMFFGLPIVAFDLTEHRVSAGPAALFADPTASGPWPGASASCWTTRPAGTGWARPAASGCSAVLAWEHRRRVLPGQDRPHPLAAGLAHLRRRAGSSSSSLMRPARARSRLGSANRAAGPAETRCSVRS